jgi:hypothetical protein
MELSSSIFQKKSLENSQKTTHLQRWSSYIGTNIVSNLSKTHLQRWSIYIGAIIISNLMLKEIVNNFKILLFEKICCFIFGSTLRCDSLLKACKISITGAMICWVLNLFSILTTQTFLAVVSRIEIVVGFLMMVMWAFFFVHVIKWTYQTTAILQGDLAVTLLFLKILTLIILFYYGTLISCDQLILRERLLEDR